MTNLFPKLMAAFALTIMFGLQAVLAAPSTDELLPNTTKAYFAVPDLDDLQQRFEKTQIHQLMTDPVIKPFAEDLKRQLQSRFDQTGIRLGISFDDLENLNAGEAASAVLAVEDEEQPHALALIVDVTGSLEAAQELVDRIGKELIEQGAKESITEVAGQEVTKYTVTDEDNPEASYSAYYIIHNDHIIATDHTKVLADIMSRFENPGDDNVASIEAYQVAMQRCKEASAVAPQIRWFVEPFGYAKTIQAAAGVVPEGKNFQELLLGQGFGAIRGLGGWVVVAEGENEFTHHTFVYAPHDVEGVKAQIAIEDEAAANGTEKDKRIAAKDSDRYRLAARMLDFPNSENQTPQTWIPSNVSTYTTMNWNLRDSFEYAKSLVNEYLDAEEGQDLFEEILKGIAHDVNGPQLNIRDELVSYLAGRVSIMTGFKTPVDVDTHQWLAAIDVTDAPAVRKAVAKFMSAEPNKQEREFNGFTIYEVLNVEEEIDVELNVDFGDGFGGEGFGGDEDFGGDEGFGGEDFGAPEEATGSQPLISQWAVTVSDSGHIIVASSADFIEDLLREQEAPKLDGTDDYQRVDAALKSLGADSTSMRMFSRLDKKNEPNYKLLQQGKMQQSDTIAGKLLGRLMGPANEDKKVEKLDVSKMPEFEKVAKYLGPAGTYVQTREDGWFISGAVLKKN